MVYNSCLHYLKQCFSSKRQGLTRMCVSLQGRQQPTVAETIEWVSEDFQADTSLFFPSIFPGVSVVALLNIKVWIKLFIFVPPSQEPNYYGDMLCKLHPIGIWYLLKEQRYCLQAAISTSNMVISETTSFPTRMFSFSIIITYLRRDFYLLFSPVIKNVEPVSHIYLLYRNYFRGIFAAFQWTPPLPDVPLCN